MWFTTRNLVIDHYEEDHSIELDYENFVLESTKIFEEWRSKLQAETHCRFIKRTYSRTKMQEVSVYCCHWSDCYESRNWRRHSGRSKFTEYKRLRGHCPAQLDVTFYRHEDCYMVRYQKIHLGHEVKTTNDAQKIHLGREVKTTNDPQEIHVGHQVGIASGPELKKRDIAAGTVDAISILTDAVEMQLVAGEIDAAQELTVAAEMQPHAERQPNGAEMQPSHGEMRSNNTSKSGQTRTVKVTSEKYSRRIGAYTF